MADVSLTAATERHRLDLFPWHVAVAVVLICLLGIWNLASASRSAHAPVWVMQAWVMGGGAVLALLITLFDHRAYQRLAWVFYVLVIGLLALVHAKGRVVMGAQRWIGFGSLNLQPSELAKIAVIMVLASWFHGMTVPRPASQAEAGR